MEQIDHFLLSSSIVMGALKNIHAIRSLSMIQKIFL